MEWTQKAYDSSDSAKPSGNQVAVIIANTYMVLCAKYLSKVPSRTVKGLRFHSTQKLTS